MKLGPELAQVPHNPQGVLRTHTHQQDTAAGQLACMVTTHIAPTTLLNMSI